MIIIQLTQSLPINILSNHKPQGKGTGTETPPFYFVFPEGCLDKPGSFVEFSLLMVGQRELSELILNLLTGGCAQEF